MAGRVPFAFLLLAAWSAAAWAQLPEAYRFDPNRLDLRKLDRRWQIATRDRVLKEFDRGEDAQAALRLIRELRINQHVVIGGSRPVIEYWLCDGRPPISLSARRLPLVSFDEKTLKVEAGKGQWLVRDALRPLFSFGASEADARQALAALQQHQFNRVGYLGDPPVMMYFLALPAATPRGSHAPPPSRNPSPLALLPLPTLAAPNPLLLPLEGGETPLPIDWQRVALLRDGAVWKLIEGNQTLAEVGASQVVAEQAVRVLKQYRFTEQCRSGTSPQAFRCFLVDGQAPRGVLFGLRSIAFRPQQLTLRKDGDAWIIWNMNQPLLRGGATEEEAQQALRLIQTHGFDRLCWIGSPSGEGFQFLVKEN